MNDPKMRSSKMKALKLAIIIGISICLVVLGIYYIGYKRFYAQHSIPFYRFKIIKKYPHNQDYLLRDW